MLVLEKVKCISNVSNNLYATTVTKLIFKGYKVTLVVLNLWCKSAYLLTKTQKFE